MRNTQIMQDPYLQKLKKSSDPASVIQEFLDDELDPNYIDNLGGLCEAGGYPDEDTEPEYVVKSAVIQGSSCSVVCKVYFEEKWFGGGCPDMPSREHRQGECRFTVNLYTGEVEWG